MEICFSCVNFFWNKKITKENYFFEKKNSTAEISLC